MDLYTEYHTLEEARYEKLLKKVQREVCFCNCTPHANSCVELAIRVTDRRFRPYIPCPTDHHRLRF